MFYLLYDLRVLKVEPFARFGGLAYRRPVWVSGGEVIEVDVLGVVGFLAVGF